NPSFSISKTKRSFFFIKSMIALISLRSLGSTTCSCKELRRLGKAVLGMRSRQSWLSLCEMIESSPVVDFKIIEETDDYAVVDKPPFLQLPPTKRNGRRTLFQDWRELFALKTAGGAKISIINRLDRETSGLVLVAKNPAVARRFGLLMQGRHLKKEYLAVVYG